LKYLLAVKLVANRACDASFAVLRLWGNRQLETISLQVGSNVLASSLHWGLATQEFLDLCGLDSSENFALGLEDE
jgi:hypothetical protein